MKATTPKTPRLLTGGEIIDGMREIGGEWSREEKSITRNVEFRSFDDAIKFINKMAKIADELNHHPEFTLKFNVLDIRITTYSAGGLTIKDFELADKLERQIKRL